MHELSIARNILEIVHQNISEKELINVRSVRLKIGALSGVVPDSLEFSFSAITAGTPLEHAHLEIEKIPFSVYCKHCEMISQNDLGLSVCPGCYSTETKILSGTELEVVNVELADKIEESS